VLLVEPDALLRHGVALQLAEQARVHAEARFETAASRLQAADGSSYGLLVTNLRLDAYNGLHLVYLMQHLGLRARTVVYAGHADRLIAREAQSAGAFFERLERIPRALTPYLLADLPEHDRRSADAFDRRAYPRGGRRWWDAQLLRPVQSL
jgi:DNA-binding NtrC family response regulator